MNRFALILLVTPIFWTPCILGQEAALKRVEARVTAASTGVAHIDLGDSSHIQIGDRVIFYPTGSADVEGVVRATTATTARVQVRDTSQILDPGTRCDVQVPARRERPAADQEPKLTTIAARCTGTDQGVATIDHGAGSCIHAGDAVVFKPKDGLPLKGVVITVGDRSARVQLEDSAGNVPRGTRCDVLVPRERIKAARKSEAGKAHGGRSEPKWTQPPEEWDQSKPLLAQPKALKPEARKKRLHGRLYLMVDALLDNERSKRESYTSRAGLDMQAENLFGNGGTLDLDLEVNYLATLLPDRNSESDGRVRLDRLAYSWGGTREAPGRWSVGRFLQHEFPELGVLDGAEYSYRFEGGDRVGASLGFLPEPDLDYKTGEDFQGSVFYRYVMDQDETFSVAGAFQQTFHDGAVDRDLLLTRIRWQPDKSLSLFGSAWIDFYGSGDGAKSSAVELTELHINAIYRWESGDGIMLTLTHIRFPELKRNEFSSLPSDALSDNHNERFSLRGWKGITDDIRASARADFWTDQDSSGGGGELRCDVRNLFWEHFNAGVTVFGNDARFTSSVGFRMQCNFGSDFGFWHAFWETAVYDQQNRSGESLWQHRIRLSWDYMLAQGLNTSIYIEQRFGDDQNSLNLGAYLQYNF